MSKQTWPMNEAAIGKRIDDLREAVELFMEKSAFMTAVDALEIKSKLTSMNDGETYHVMDTGGMYLVCYGRELNYWMAKGLHEISM